MALKRRSGGSFTNVASVKRRSGGAWVGVSNIYRRSGGAWVLVWSAYTAVTASTSPSPLYGTAAPNDPIVEVLHVTAANGTGSYTYSTTWLSGGSGLTLSGGSTANITVSGAAPGASFTRSGTLRTVVSDGVSSYTVDTSVTFEWIN